MRLRQWKWMAVSLKFRVQIENRAPPDVVQSPNGNRRKWNGALQ
jgi:hypothetical protein